MAPRRSHSAVGQRDARFDRFRQPDELSRRLRAKTRHNAVTILLHLLVLWFLLLAAVVALLAAVDLYSLIGPWVLPAAGLAMLLLTLGTLVLVERAADGVPAAATTSLLDLRAVLLARTSGSGSSRRPASSSMFNGTPLKGLIWRLLGVRIGRRVFDDGCSIPEKSLVTSATTAC